MRYYEPTPKEALDEYMRRNSAHACSCGVVAGISTIQDRLLQMKRPPKWLVTAMKELAWRAAVLPEPLAHHRDQVRHFVYREGTPEKSLFNLASTTPHERND